MSAKVLGEVATVASNGTNGATVVGSGNAAEIILSVGAFVSGMVSTAEVVSEVDFRKALPLLGIIGKQPKILLMNGEKKHRNFLITLMLLISLMACLMIWHSFLWTGRI